MKQLPGAIQGLLITSNPDEVLAASPPWRALTVAFFKYLSAGSPEDSSKFPIPPNPIRIMPGGLERIVEDGFTLLGSGKVNERHLNSVSSADGGSEWMRPISGEKIVYNIL